MSGSQPADASQQPGRQSDRETAGSVTDILGEESGKRFLKYIVGVYAVVAIGYGIGLFLLDAIGGSEVATIGYVSLFVPILGAPIIAMVTGLLTGLRLETDDRSAALTSAVGAFVGFVVLLFLILIFASIVADGGSSGGGGGGGSLSDFFGPLVAFGTGVAATGAGTTYVVKRIGI
ncbi:hypothetical protein [Halovivax limisalsi]|uniref:hypothetical protein n=1 Tax=Halovivax limisalsi TaxID=1453760 RepID=UPI001FFD7EA5|nr:hypothetical protein [Halovivax limisalsi]